MQSRILFIEKILLFSIPAVFQLVGMGQINSNMMYIPLIFAVCIEYVYYRRPVLLTKQYGLFGGLLAITYLFCSVFSFEMNMSDLAYIGLIFLFYLAIPIIGSVIAEDVISALGILLFSNSVFLLPQIVSNLSTITSSQIINSLALDSESRFERGYFNYQHPNTAAFMISVEIILLLILLIKEEKALKKLFYTVSIIFMLICLMSTGSRTAVLSCVVLFSVLIIAAVLNYVPRFRILGYFILTIIMIYCLIQTDFVSQLILNSSGRYSHASTIITQMVTQGKVIFGVGVHQISSGLISSILGLNVFVDCWYVYIFVCTGVIGFVSILIALIYEFRFLVNSACTQQNKVLIMGMIAFLSMYGLAENVVFVPGVILSVVNWILLDGLSKSDI